jgi:hypothetical protein
MIRRKATSSSYWGGILGEGWKKPVVELEAAIINSAYDMNEAIGQLKTVQKRNQSMMTRDSHQTLCPRYQARMI